MRDATIRSAVGPFGRNNVATTSLCRTVQSVQVHFVHWRFNFRSVRPRNRCLCLPQTNFEFDPTADFRLRFPPPAVHVRFRGGAVGAGIVEHQRCG